MQPHAQPSQQKQAAGRRHHTLPAACWYETRNEQRKIRRGKERKTATERGGAGGQGRTSHAGAGSAVTAETSRSTAPPHSAGRSLITSSSHCSRSFAAWVRSNPSSECATPLPSPPFPPPALSLTLLRLWMFRSGARAVVVSETCGAAAGVGEA
jgi:hypothetical protein